MTGVVKSVSIWLTIRPPTMVMPIKCIPSLRDSFFIKRMLVNFMKVAATLRSLNEALIKERTRQWGSKEPQISDNPEAAHLQKVGHDIPKTVAERVVKEHRRRKLLDMPPGSDKVH
jgi:hypothetical protein